MWLVKEIWYHRRQHGLNIIAITAAFVLVMTVSILSSSVIRQVSRQFDSLGLDVSMIQLLDEEVPGGWFEQWCEENDIQCASVFYSHSYGELTVSSCSASISRLFHWPYRQGHFFSTDEELLNDNVAVLGHQAWEYFMCPSLGSYITIAGVSFSVCGILEELEGSLFIDADNTVFVPAGYHLYDGSNRSYYFTGSAEGLDDYLRSSQYVLVEQGQLNEAVITVMNIISEVMLMLSYVSVGLAFVGMVNNVLSSLPQRCHEIGIKKAFGASNAQIYVQFLLETAAVIAASLLLCLPAGILLMKLVGSMENSGQLASRMVIISLAGIICGLYPAYKASTITVMEAVRSSEQS